MLKSESLLNKFKDRKSIINLDINADIKTLQRKLVSLSFSTGNNSSEYTWILEEIKDLRNKIITDVNQ